MNRRSFLFRFAAAIVSVAASSSLARKLALPSLPPPASAPAAAIECAAGLSPLDSVTIGGRTFVFKSALAAGEDGVLIGASPTESMRNLTRAINGSDCGQTAVASGMRLQIGALA